MGRPSNVSLTRDALRDLVSDIRCERRWIAEGVEGGMTTAERRAHAAECEATFRRVWPTRHTCRVGRYGMPEGM